MKLDAGKVTTAQFCEIIRDGLVNSMKYGTTLALNMDTGNPDFAEKYNKPEGLDHFDTDLIFNRQKFLEDENYKLLLKDGEDHDELGNIGGFWAHKDFQLALVYTYKNDQQV